MPLRALLSEVHPAWYASEGGPAFDPALVELARRTALGQRLLVRALPHDFRDGLLAPRPGADTQSTTLHRWPRTRALALARDLGVLACAPMIRGEVRREPVRWLRKTLGNSYLLALDRSIWDGRLERATHARLAAEWDTLVAAPGFLTDPSLLGTYLDRQGRGELHAWASRRNRPLADWMRLLHDDEPPCAAHLPEKSVLVVVTHHDNRDGD